MNAQSKADAAAHRWRYLDAVANSDRLAPVDVRLVLRLVCRYLNQATGTAYPSVARLASDIGVSERHARRTLAHLVDLGVLVRDAGGGCAGGGRGRTNAYRIPETLTHMSGFSGAETMTPMSGLDDETRTPMSENPDTHVRTTRTHVSPEPTDNNLPKEPAEIEGRARVHSDDLSEAIQTWNDMASRSRLPECQKLTKARQSQLVARLKDCGGIEGWKAAIDKVEASAFLRGETGERRWEANIDFVLRESSFVKLMEGAYDNATASRKDGVMAGLRDEIEGGNSFTRWAI
jgi:hypothetical protein